MKIPTPCNVTFIWS